jgi:hypothetical protein
LNRNRAPTLKAHVDLSDNAMVSDHRPSSTSSSKKVNFGKTDGFGRASTFSKGNEIGSDSGIMRSDSA